MEKKYSSPHHSILHYLDKDNPRGPIPEQPENDPMYVRWEEAIKNWAKRKGIIFDSPPTEDDDLHTPFNQPKVQINYPFDGANVDPGLVSIDVLAEAPRGLRQVEGLINNLSFDKIYSPPYNLSLNTTGLSQASHKITIRACDDIDNCANVSININLTQTSSPIISFLSPKNNENIYVESFPYLISLSLPIMRIKEIKLYLQKIGILEKELLAKISFPVFARLNINWLDNPAPGQYELFLEAINENGWPVNSEKIIINIL